MNLASVVCATSKYNHRIVEPQPDEQLDPHAITALLANWRGGDSAACDALMTIVYGELRRMAAHYLQHERRNNTLQPTVLVHEVYLRLIAAERVSWQNRAHFLAFAAQIMRHFLVDHARSRLAGKRGGGCILVSLDGVADLREKDQEILLLDGALNKLAELDARAARVVEARFFGGLTEAEAAEVLGISVATLKRDWQFARAWLYEQLKTS
jgi:RNA polymerase sigma factor (TIGR02999 family)